MARRSAELALCALLVAACGGGGASSPSDAPESGLCATSDECGVGNWCNPLGPMCEPRGTTFQFDGDIYPELRDVCAGCHVAGVKDTQTGGTIAVFAGGADAAYASLVQGGTTCSAGPHRLCVDEPKASEAVMRLLTHVKGDGSLLLPAGYADPWLQRLLHWAAAGARRGGAAPDARTADAPAVPTPDAPGTADAPAVPTPDAPLADAPPPPPDAPLPPDAPPPPDGPRRPDAVLPDASADTVPPVGGDVTAASSDSCGVVTVTIAAATDDVTPPAQLQYEVCWSTTPGGCLTSFSAGAHYTSPGNHTIDLSSQEGTTLYFAGRAVDQAGNHSTPSATQPAAIPKFLSWTAGAVTLTKTAGPGTYDASWPTVSTRCAGKPLTVKATCTSASACACTTAADGQSATCTTSTCDTINVSVKATAGTTSATRTASYTVHFAEASPVYDNAGCRSGCHTSPTFTTADKNTAGNPLCTSNVYISPGSSAQSLIYVVATQHAFICGGAHNDGNMSASDQELLRCWIDGGAL